MDNNHENTKEVLQKKEQSPLSKKVLIHDAKDLTDGIIKNVVKPRVNDMMFGIVDSILNTIRASVSMAIFKDFKPPSDSRTGYRVDTYSYSNTNYHGISNSSQQKNNGIKYNEVTFNTYDGAMKLYSRLEAIYKKYNRLRVSDVYNELRDIAPNAKGDFTNSNYGWTTMQGFAVVNDADGWYIQYPQPKYIL